MRERIFAWSFVIICISFLSLGCRNNPQKPKLSHNVIVKTEDSIVFKQLKKISSYCKADSFYFSDAYDSAIYYYNKTFSDKNLPTDKKYIQEIFNRIGYTYVLLSDYKKAKHFLTKASFLGNGKSPNLIDANTFNYLGLLYRYTNESDSALYYLNKSFQICLSILGDQTIQIVRLNLQIGDVYRWIRFDYYNAEVYFYKALQIFESQGFDKRDDQYWKILYYLASTNRLKKDFNKSLSYGIQALQLAKTIENHKRYIEISYALVANIYLALKEFNNSIAYYKEALNINSKALKTNTDLRPLYLNNLAYANYELGNYEKTIAYCEQAFRTFDKKAPDFNNVSWTHEYLGQSYLKLHLYPKAFSSFKECAAIRLKHIGEKHPLTAGAFSLLSNYYAAVQNFDSALYYVQLAIINGSEKFNNFNIQSNPLLSQSTRNSELIDYLAFKASVLKQKYIQHPTDTASLSLSLKSYELLDSLISFSRKSMDMEMSKLAFSTSRNELYEEAIDCAFQLYQLHNDKVYIAEAFRFFEKNKYLLLLEKLKMAEAASKAGVPANLVEHERALNYELKFVQDKLAEEQNKTTPDVMQTQSLNARSFKLMREIEKLHNTFQQQYPNYFKIKYQDITTSLEDLQKYSIQKNLDINQYFWGKGAIYLIGVSGNQLHFFRIKNSQEFSDSLVDFIGMMHDVNLSSKEKYHEYAKKANSLYQELIKPGLFNSNSGNAQAHKLTIIPDGILSKLSFDALITSLPHSTKFSYKNLNYMVYQYNIEYAYSSNILLGNLNDDRKKYINKLLGFGFSGADRGPNNRLSNKGLPGTLDEMKAVAAYFRSRIYIGQDASEFNFKKKVSDFDIIHLAIHGSADEEKESGSKLMFRTDKDTIEDGVLYANEIYNLNLKAKLVVLSACETGIGKNYQGEGVFSMARAFAYAGCPSIVISLWKVNDRSTATVMGNFYKYLAKGDEIGQSLHKAKLDYLDGSDEIGAQPVYWASFVAFGDMSPLKSRDNLTFWLGLTAILIIGGIIIYLAKKTPKSSGFIQSLKKFLAFNTARK